VHERAEDRQLSQFAGVIAALDAEGREVTALVAGLEPDRWALPTPAPGWTVLHQVAHLAATFELFGLAAGDPAAFQELTARLSPDFDADVEAALQRYLVAPSALLELWRTELASGVNALAAVPSSQLVPWVVRPMPPGMLARAGLMELFGHGQDIADTLGIRPVRTDRIRYLVEFAIRSWDFGYLARGLAPPPVRFRYELTAPSGARWTFGSEDAGQKITGPALDFCLLVSRRRHRADLAITATGPEADRWIDLAQAYRGAPGAGRRPGQFADSPAA